MSYIRAKELYSEGYVAIIGYLHPLFRLHSPCHKNLNLDCILVAHSGFHLTRNQPYGGELKVLKVLNMSDWSRRGSRQRLGKAGRAYVFWRPSP